MSWLDQIKARRVKKSGPVDGKTAFSGYEFTEDRREKARKAREESGTTANLFQNATLNQSMEVEEQEQPVIEPVEFEGDALEEAEETPVERGKPRRSAKRIRTPLDLYYFPTPDHFVPLELTVLYRDGGTKAVDCFLFDVSDSGIGFASPTKFDQDSELTVLGHHAEDMTPLIATDVTIVNHRPFPEDKQAPGKFAGRSLWLHGTRMDLQDAMLLYKATLDSIALNVALANSVVDDDKESDEGEEAPEEQAD